MSSRGDEVRVDIVLQTLSSLSRQERDVVLHAVRRAYPTHCFARDCLRGSPAGDRFTAILDLSTFRPDGCECNCAACHAADTHYAAEGPIE